MRRIVPPKGYKLCTWILTVSFSGDVKRKNKIIKEFNKIIKGTTNQIDIEANEEIAGFSLDVADLQWAWTHSTIDCKEEVVDIDWLGDIDGTNEERETE